MKKSILKKCFVRVAYIVLFLFLVNPTHAQNIDQSCTSNGDYWNLNSGCSSSSWAGQLGQIFTAGITGNLDSIELKTGSTNSSSANYDFHIIAYGFDPIVGAFGYNNPPIYSVIGGALSTPNTANTNFTITLSSPVALTAGQNYLLLLVHNSGSLTTLATNNSGSCYSGGQAYICINGQVNLGLYTALDLDFKTFMSSSSSDATLSAMTLSSGTLSPSFASGTTTYASSVTSSITVTPTRNEAHSTIQVRVNGGTYAAVNSGSASSSLALNVGSNTVDVLVTAQDGTTTKTYTTTVTRTAAPTITSFSPESGPIGTLVSITGTNLNTPIALTIGGVSAIAVSNTGTSLVAMVMPGAATGAISVTTAGGTANGASNFTVTPSQVPNTQQGNKLVGTGNTGTAQQGWSVSISADGNTAIVGGGDDNSGQGAAWVYTRSGGVWTQQGSKLVGTGNTGAAQQGTSVSISADGNTAIVGGYADNTYQGAVWVYTRSGSVWTQQGSKLVGTGNTGAAYQGWSVSISADGNTAIVGGYYDNMYQGAVWIFKRINGTWTQQGSKLVGTGNTGAAELGYSVSISADGNTAIVGGYKDNSFCATCSYGAAWIFACNGGTWTQQGSKLVGTGNTGAAELGTSVGISADGNTVIIGGPNDNMNHADSYGAAWIFTRSAGIWSQQTKLVGTGNTGLAKLGIAVGISADGNTAIVGGYKDNVNQGATWIFTRSAGTWTQNGSKLIGTGNTGGAQQGFSVIISADGSSAIVGGNLDNSSQGAAWGFTVPLSNNADLNAMSISSGTLSPAFTASTIAYTASTSVSNITVTPTSDDANATIQVRVNGGAYAAVNSGSASSSLALNLGSNTIDVLVTAQDGTTTKIYTTTVTRTSNSNADLSGMVFNSGTLSPSFISTTTAYTLITNIINNITVTPTKADANATLQVSVNGGAYASVNSGSASNALALNVGINTIDVLVTAQNGTTTKTYTTTIINSASSSNPCLSMQLDNYVSGGTNNETVSRIVGSNITNTVRGQSFTSSLTGTLSRLYISVGNVSTPGNCVIKIYNGHGFGGTLLYTSTSVMVNTSFKNYEFDLNVPVTASSQYTWEMSTTSAVADIQIIYSSGSFLGGSMLFSSITTSLGGGPGSSTGSSGSPSGGGPSFDYATIICTSPNNVTSCSNRTLDNSVTGGNSYTLNHVLLSPSQKNINGQSFTSTLSGALSRIDIPVGNVITPGNCIIKIYNGHGFGGALLYTSAPVFVNSSFSTYQFNLSLPVSANSQYTWEMSTTTLGADIENIYSSGTFSGGSMLFTSITTAPGGGPGGSTGTSGSPSGGGPSFDYATYVSICPNVDLINLSLSSGTLSPAFTSGITTYTASTSASSITVIPTSDDANSTLQVRINGGTYASVLSGSPSASLFLNVGSNTIDVLVTGLSTKTYTTTVTRTPGSVSSNADLSDLLLSSGNLNPTFTSSTISYTASTTASTISVTPTKADANATIQVRINGGAYASVNSGSASSALALNVGINTIDVLVTAENGTTIKIYTVTVTRLNPSISVTGTFAAFTSCLGTVSSQQSFTVSASGLSADVVVTPPTGFEISTTSGSGFAPSVTLTQVGGTVASTTIYVRLTNLATGTPSGNITCTSTGATTQNVVASGTVNDLATFTSSPSNISKNVTPSTCAKVVNYTAVASGLTPTLTYAFVGATIGSGNGTGNGSSFNKGITTVTLTADNGCAPAATTSFTVTIIDNEAPVLTQGADQNVNLDSNCAVTIPNVLGTATDNCSGTTITQSPPAGTVVSSSHNATINVTVTATDLAGLTDIETVILTAKDITAPTITCPANINLNATNGLGVVVTYTAPVGTDNCAAPTTIMIAGLVSGTLFPIGTTTVTYQTTDAAGLTNTCSFDVIIDRIAPIVNNFTPSNGCAQSTIITINGTGFTGANSVKIGGVEVSSFTINSDSEIEALATGSSSGVIAVSNIIGNGSSVNTFTLNPLPIISTTSLNNTICLGQSVDLTITNAVTTLSPITSISLGNNDFSLGKGTGWTFSNPNGGDTTTYNGNKVLGRFNNEQLTYNQTGFGVHSSVTVEFDLYIHDSWDGNGYNNSKISNPDNWKMSVNGTNIINTSFANSIPGQAWSANPQSYPNSLPTTNNAPYTGAVSNNLPSACNGSSFASSKYRISRTVPHTSSSISVVLEGLGLENICNESWSIDNFEVITNLQTIISNSAWSAPVSNNTTVTVNPTTSSTYTATNGICPASVQITVNPYPVANFTINNATQCLSGNSFDFTNTSSGATTYQWNMTGAATTNSTSTDVNANTYALQGHYNVTLVAALGTCTNSSTQTVMVNNPLTITATPSGPICAGTTVRLTSSQGGTTTTTGTVIFTPNTTNNFENGIGSDWTFPNNNGNIPMLFTFNGSNVLGRFGAQKAIYSQTGLGTNHEAVKIEFDLYIHDSWDGNGYNNENANNNPDIWRMTVNGNSTINTTFTNGNEQAWRDYPQAYPANLGVAINPPSTGAITSTLPSPLSVSDGFGTTKYRISRTIAHNSDNLLIELEALNLEILSNESWSIDNFNLEVGSSLGTVTSGTPLLWTGGTATGAITNYVDVAPSTSTTYSVSDGGICASAPITITVSPTPTPSFILSNGSCSKTVSFTNTNEEVGVNYVWNYGDGSATFTGANSPTHNYTNGTYTVTLSANFPGGCVITTTRTVTIGDQPNATISFVGGTGCGSTVQFTGNTDLALGNTPTYLWSFGETPTPSTSAIQNPSKTFLSNGTYNVTFTVNNGNGCVSMASTNVTVNAALGSGSQAIFTATVVNDACGNKVTTVNNSIGPNTNYLWNFGDGSFSSEIAPTHYYETGGLKTITLTIVGATGCGANSNQIIGINENNGNAGRVGLTLTVSPTTTQPLIGNNFAFDITHIDRMPVGGSFIGAAGQGTWTYGDGTGSNATDVASKIYTTAGNFTIRFTQTTTNTGCINEVSKVLTVLPTPLLQFQNSGLQTVEQGSNNYAATTGIYTLNKKTEMVLYPNPNNGNFVVEVTNLTIREGDVTVIDILGREVYKATYNLKTNKTIIEVSNLNIESGTYYIVLNANGVTQARKQFVMVSK